MSPATRILLLLLGATLIGCQPRGDDDDTADDDDAANDDDSADDDDATADDDDDDTTADDDDATGGTAPVIDGVSVCDTQIIGTSYLRFQIEVSDPDGDLLDPVAYFLTYENAENGATSPLTQYTVNEDMFNGGTISHLVEIGIDGIERGVGFEFSWFVRDSAGQSSATWVEGYFINSAPGSDPC